MLRLGGSPTLKPEEGKTWSVGFDWLPEFAEGLKVSSTYYSIAYDNRILTTLTGGLNTASFLANPANRQIYSSYIIPTPAVAGCTPNDRSTWNPLLRDAYENPTIPQFGRSFLYGNESFATGNICDVRAILDARNTNAASTLQTGIDLQFDYAFEALQSSWNAGVSASKILKNEQTLVSGLPTTDILGRILFPVDLTARANLTWGRGGWSATLYGNYVDGFRNDLPISVAGVLQPASDVPSWFTMDLNVGYSVPANAGHFLEGVRVNATARNMFDRDPPVVLSGNDAMDARNHSPYGRIVQFSLTKRF
jgi:iron complex outermembrane receptor protein